MPTLYQKILLSKQPLITRTITKHNTDTLSKDITDKTIIITRHNNQAQNWHLIQRHYCQNNHYNPDNNQAQYRHFIQRHYCQSNHYNPNNNLAPLLTLYPKTLLSKQPIITRHNNQAQYWHFIQRHYCQNNSL